MQRAVRGEAFKRCDRAGYRRGWRDAGAQRDAIDDDRTGSALPQPAAEPWATQPEVVAQHIEKRGRRIDVYCVDRAVDA